MNQVPEFLSAERNPLDEDLLQPQKATPAVCAFLADVGFQYGFDPEVVDRLTAVGIGEEDQTLIGASLCGRSRRFYFDRLSVYEPGTPWMDSNRMMMRVSARWQSGKVAPTVVTPNELELEHLRTHCADLETYIEQLLHLLEQKGVPQEAIPSRPVKAPRYTLEPVRDVAKALEESKKQQEQKEPRRARFHAWLREAMPESEEDRHDFEVDLGYCKNRAGVARTVAQYKKKFACQDDLVKREFAEHVLDGTDLEKEYDIESVRMAISAAVRGVGK